MPLLALIDDDLEFLTALSRHLAGYDIELAIFTTISEFADEVRSGRYWFDIVSFDLRMQDTSGVLWDLGGLSGLTLMRTLFPPDELPMICVMSGMDVVAYASTCRANGADCYIAKRHDVGLVARDLAQRIGLKRVAAAG